MRGGRGSLTDCLFCREAGGEILWQSDQCRVVLAGEPDYPGFLRVVLKRHVREMSDLDAADREALMRAVFAAESALRSVLNPHKINLASLGNQVPHLHWHVIPRFPDDAHFPDPVWAAPLRSGAAHVLDPEAVRAVLARLLG